MVHPFLNGEGMRGGRVHHSIADFPFLGEARTAPRYRFYSMRIRLGWLCWSRRARGFRSSRCIKTLRAAT
jgi:hypothetical protein